MFRALSLSLVLLLAPAGPGRPVRSWRISADHWLAGGLQEFSFSGYRVRGFTTGMFGLTRYAAESDSEFRFTLSAGGGVKLLPSSRFGATVHRGDQDLHELALDGGLLR